MINDKNCNINDLLKTYIKNRILEDENSCEHNWIDCKMVWNIVLFFGY